MGNREFNQRCSCLALVMQRTCLSVSQAAATPRPMASLGANAQRQFRGSSGRHSQPRTLEFTQAPYLDRRELPSGGRHRGDRTCGGQFRAVSSGEVALCCSCSFFGILGLAVCMECAARDFCQTGASMDICRIPATEVNPERAPCAQP